MKMCNYSLFIVYFRLGELIQPYDILIKFVVEFLHDTGH